MTFPDHLIPQIAEIITDELKGVTRYDPHNIAKDRVAVGRAVEQIEVLQKYTPLELENLKILEVGSSFGTFQSYVASKDSHVFGIEPSLDAIKIGQAGWENLPNPTQVVNSIGENLPFASESFDLVYSSNVLEHVQEPNLVIRESLRVLKVGGYLQFVFPNYGSIWDGHYSLPWIPYAPYWLGKFYVRMFGRAPYYVDTLQLLNIFTVRRILAEHPNIEILSMGSEMFSERLNNPEFMAWGGMGNLDKAVGLIQKMKLIQLAGFIGKQFALYTPFIITLQKHG